MTQQNNRIQFPGEQLNDVLLAMAREAVEITDDDLQQSMISLIQRKARQNYRWVNFETMTIEYLQ